MNTLVPQDLPRRQVHLDFHTSPLFPGIGSRFDKKQFQEALKAGHVNSITVFAKCHHGLCYYPTKVGQSHPGLAKDASGQPMDLTGAMIEAAHEIGVRAPIYITAGFSEEDGKAHPEWTARHRDGSIRSTNIDFNAAGNDAKPHCGWLDLCLNDGSYARHIYELTEEICQRYEKVDGLFYDIVFRTAPCYCSECQAGMRAEGLDPTSEADALKYYEEKHIVFMQKCKAILDQYHPGATVFFNSGGADPYRPIYHPYSTHFEMEDLPTAWGGYNKMPFNAKFFSKLGKFYLGMTGKFHLDWGEFGGFKPKEALRYEAATMALYGAACSIGDHLFPDGVMDPQTYENIGYAYEYLEKIEPYCFGGESTARLGFVMADREENSGLIDILIENQIDFELLMAEELSAEKLSAFETLILPAGIDLSALQIEALKTYLAEGGKILAIGNSIIQDGAFVLDCGLKDPVSGEGLDYVLPSAKLNGDLPRSPFLIYGAGIQAEAVDGEVLAEGLLPVFARTYEHFYGHRNAPYDKNAARYPAAVKKGGLVWTAHDLPAIYKTWGSLFYRRYFISLLELIFDNPCRVRLHSEGRCRLIDQTDQQRYCLNMTYASPYQRGAAEIIDEILPLYDIPAAIRTEKTIHTVRTLIGGEILPFKQENGVCTFTIPKLQCHECVILEYK